MQKTADLIVVIPAYEPKEAFIKHAFSVASSAKELVVVDDGSGEKYSHIFKAIDKIPNVKLITLNENHGKGYALKAAFSYCIRHFCHDDIIVTADCDGQHKLKDILKVYELALKDTSSLTLGVRNFSFKNVPKRSRLGNKLSIGLYRMLYGENISDTQTGLRGFSVKYAELFFGVRGNRFDYEMAMLIYAAKNGIRVNETEIETVYPEKPGEHTSHFKTVSDSLKIMLTVLWSMNFYMLSSVISGAVDVLIFFVITTYLLPPLSPFNIMIATVSARIVSSLLNFFLNYKYVFGKRSSTSIFKYYVLCILQLSASYTLTLIFGNIIKANITAVKVIIDIILGVISYRIQRIWVFREDRKVKIYSKGARLILGISKLFSKEYKCTVKPPVEGTVYVCRHMNMHGPYTTIKWLPFDTHVFTFNVFFDKDSCYNQYSQYTFKKHGGAFVKPRAYIASRIVPGLVASFGAVPVFRDGRTVKTLKTALDLLEKGESIIVYPDVEYDDKSHGGDIYDGFLYLGELYRKRFKRDLSFVPIYIDDKTHTVREYEPVIVNDYSKDRKKAKSYLIGKINGNKKAKREAI